MSVRARVLIDNVAYHIVVRGNQRQKVFGEEKDFEKYLKLIHKYKNRYKTRLYAYCLMNNHVHLLMDPENKTSLKKSMHGLCMSYAKYFNYKYDKCGHLWQGRYKSFVIQKDEYLVNCITYIETNPVRAGVCQRAEEYPWSSYSSRALGKKDKILDDFVP